MRTDREKRLEELLASAHNIARRNGECVHWKRFASSIAEEGIGAITARTYKVLKMDAPDDGRFVVKDAPTLVEVDLGDFDTILHRAIYCVEKEKDMNECDEHELFLHQLENDLARLCGVLKSTVKDK